MSPKYEIAFQKECDFLSNMIIGSLQKLAINPKDTEEMQKMVQTADTIMGGARFLENKELEQTATMIVKSFSNVKDVRKKIDEYSAAFDQFGRMVARTGTCPRGYTIIDGRCVLKRN